MISSRTPEGWPNECPICGQDLRIEPSTFPVRDAPCPHCGTLLDFEEPLAQTVQFLTDDLMDMLAQLDGWAGKDSLPPLRIDCGEVKSFDSAVLGKFITCHRKAQAAGTTMVLFNVSPALHEVFAATKLDKVLRIE